MSSSQSRGTSWRQGNRSWRPKPSDRDNWRQPDALSGRNSADPGERPSESVTVPAGSSSQTSPLPSPPAEASDTTTDESRESSPPAHAQQDYSVRPGIIMHLPKGFKIGRYSESRLLRTQRWVNKEATNHFILVWDTYEAEGEVIARCMPMTSFKGTSVDEKYNRGGDAWRHQVKYLPIAQYGWATVSDTEMPSLALHNDKGLDRQTYVHLDHFFEIEVKFLQCSNPLYLVSTALSVLVYKFSQFLSGETLRANAGSPRIPPSPLDYGKRPELSPEVLARVEEGCDLEAKRNAHWGTHQWTGKEEFGPRRKYGKEPRPNRKF